MMGTDGRLSKWKHTSHLPNGYTTQFHFYSLTTAASECVGMSKVRCYSPYKKWYGGTAMVTDGNTMIFRCKINDTE